MKKLVKVLMIVSLLLGLAACSNGTKQEGVKYQVGVVQYDQHVALDAATKGFVDVLKEEFGDQVEITVNVASGEIANCATIVNGFVSEGVDLIMANATPAVQSAYSATGSIPILGTSVTEYGVALDIDNFSGVTGVNVSGTSDLAPLDEQAQMIIDLVPSAKNVGIIYCQDEANSAYQVKVVKKYLEDKGLTVKTIAFSESNNMAQIVEEGCEGVDALYIPTDNKAANYCETIYNVTSKEAIPVICGEEGTCKGCGIATLTIDYEQLGRITGAMAVKVLKGEAKVEEMPIEYYTSPVKKYNKEICETLGIEIPSDYVAVEVE